MRTRVCQMTVDRGKSGPKEGNVEGFSSAILGVVGVVVVGGYRYHKFVRAVGEMLGIWGGVCM